MIELSVSTSDRSQFVDVTAEVAGAVRECGQDAGQVTVFVPHTTAGVTINENADPDVTADMSAALEQMVPWQNGYRHCEGNSAAHVKASLMGSSVTVLFENKQLCLGTWQSIYFCEFDGPRRRKIWVRAQ